MKVKLMSFTFWLFLLTCYTHAFGEFISAEGLQELVKEKGSAIAVVDIRSREQFNCYHIEGAININPSFVKNRDFLKGRKVILVYGGINPCQALTIAEELKIRGFKEGSATEQDVKDMIKEYMEAQ